MPHATQGGHNFRKSIGSTPILEAMRMQTVSQTLLSLALVALFVGLAPLVRAFSVGSLLPDGASTSSALVSLMHTTAASTLGSILVAAGVSFLTFLGQQRSAQHRASLSKTLSLLNSPTGSVAGATGQSPFCRQPRFSGNQQTINLPRGVRPTSAVPERRSTICTLPITQRMKTCFHAPIFRTHP